MTEQMVGVVRAEVDAESHRIVPKGRLGANTSGMSSEPVDIRWRAEGQGHLITDGFISELKKLYEFRGDPGIVEAFLEENAFLRPLLFAAHKVIREHFDPEVQTALEVVADPEALGDQQLFVLIQTHLPRRAAREHLAGLDQEWWLDALPAAEGKMEIALA